MQTKLLAILILCCGLGPRVLSQDVRSLNKVPGSVESTAQRLKHALLKQGFEVSRGYFKLWRIEDCEYTAAKLGSCFGNNPASPYVSFALPAWKDEFVDDSSNVLGPSLPGYYDVYRLDPREAIVIVAQMPPPARFFSEQSWVFARQGTLSTDSDTYRNMAADPGLQAYLPLFFRTVNALHPERILLWASLGNPTNNEVMAKQAGTPFDELRYFIITPDDFMNNAVRKAFASISVHDDDVFNERVPSNMNLGLGESADNFITLMRYTRPADAVAGAQWIQNLPLVVLRVRDTRFHHQPEPYAPVTLGLRSAFDEYTLQSDQNDLISEVHRRWTGQPCLNADCSDVAVRFHDLQGFPIDAVGPHCIEIGENCVGDNWDATYHFNGPNPIDNGEIYAISGALGTETGNATYTGLGVNQSSRLIGVANLTDDQLKDTAKGYAGVVQNTDKLYLYYFARDCTAVENIIGEKNCFTIDKNLIPAGEHLTFTVRDYLRPGTERGADSTRILPPALITLQQP